MERKSGVLFSPFKGEEKRGVILSPNGRGKKEGAVAQLRNQN